MKVHHYLLLSFLFLSCQSRYEKYRIIGVSMNEILLQDSIETGRKYFIIQFETELCQPVITLFGGGIEPGLDGIEDSIQSIRIYDADRKEITPQFKGWRCEAEGIIGNNATEIPYLSFINIKGMLHSINNKDRLGIGTRIQYSRIFYFTGNSQPAKIVIDWKQKQISSRVLLRKYPYRIIERTE